MRYGGWFSLKLKGCFVCSVLLWRLHFVLFPLWFYYVYLYILELFYRLHSFPRYDEWTLLCVDWSQLKQHMLYGLLIDTFNYFLFKYPINSQYLIIQVGHIVSIYKITKWKKKTTFIHTIISTFIQQKYWFIASGVLERMNKKRI